MSYYLENLFKPDPDHPVRQALSIRHNFRVIMEKLNATLAVVNNLVVRNNIVYTYVESVDATHPFEIDFHIPTATVTIKKISLTLKGVPFRAYSKAGAAAGTPSGGAETSGSGGGQTSSSGGGQTSSEGGGQSSSSAGAASGGGSTSGNGGGQTSSVASPADVAFFLLNAGINVTVVGAESASGFLSNGTTNTACRPSHTHTVANHTHTTPAHTHPGHTHTVDNHTHTVDNHTHTVDDHTHTTPNHTHPDHTHTAVYGIYESTTPTAVNGYYDDGGGYSAADSYGNAPDTTTPWNIKTEYDITDKYSGTGWKRLKLDTSRLGRFNVILMIEVDLTPTS